MNNMEKYTKILEKICVDVSPGKKMVQKLMYLIERKGLNLELNYSIHFFGPYSSKLDNVLHILEGQDILSINTSGMTHTISINENENEFHELESKENEIVEYVLGNFINRSALELEAITTLDYVATYVVETKNDDNAIIDGVKRIKGTKFSDETLRKELSVLKQFNYLS